jgi:hypothetical protein
MTVLWLGSESLARAVNEVKAQPFLCTSLWLIVSRALDSLPARYHREAKEIGPRQLHTDLEALIA